MRKLKLLFALCAIFGGAVSADAQVMIETDLTSQFNSLATTQWTGSSGQVGWAAPQVTTNSGLTVAAWENYCGSWNGGCTNTGTIMKTTVTGLTPGTYKIELYGAAAFCYARNFGSELFTGDTKTDYPDGQPVSTTYEVGQSISENTGVYLYATTSETYKQEIPLWYADNFNGSGLSTAVLNGVVVGEDGRIEIGMLKESKSTNWHVVQLKGVTATVDAEALFASFKSQAENLYASPMKATILNDLQTAANVDLSEANAEGYKTAIENLDAKITAAKTSIANYAEAKAILDAASIYDAAGQASYAANETIAAIQSAYDNGTLEAVTAEQKTAATAALATACKAQTQPKDGCDMTPWIVNPGIDGNTDGWTCEKKGNGTMGGPLKPSNDAMEFWGASTVDNNASSKFFDYYQTIVNLPTGAYSITADMFNSTNDEEKEDGHDGVNWNGGGKAGLYGKTEKDEVKKLITTNGTDFLSYTTDEILVVDGELRLGVKNVAALTGRWFVCDNFKLTYVRQLTDIEKEAISSEYETTLEAAKAIAEGTIPTAAYTALQGVITSNTLDDGTPKQYFNATKALSNATTTATPLVEPYTTWKSIKSKADAIADVEYKEITEGCHSTFTSTISSQNETVDATTSLSDLNTAIASARTALNDAIKTYIAGAEPKNDGEYFDITCLMTNPNFDDSHNGWTYLAAPGVNWSNCEYYQSEFDINQTVTDLPTGSYSLSVQAFQRPGWAGNVYNDYINGTDNASSVLYINNISSNVKNIAADAQATYKLGDGSNFGWPNDSQVGSEGNYKYVPNSQQGANLWFAAGLYDATCAAVVDDAANGSLKLGFKSTKDHVAGDWTIFDNFRLYYYGSSLLVYYKQYLPQLKSEAGADLNNALYNNIQGVERSEFSTALGATPASETEEAYKAVIDAITEKQAAFRAALTAYDALTAAKAASLTKISTNIGTGVFQYNETTNNSLYSAYENAKGDVDDYTVNSSSTADAIQPIVDAYNTAVSNYNNQALNAPDAEKRYYMNIIDEGQEWNGNAITFIAGGRNDMGGYSIQYLAPKNANLNQALKFTAVDGETNTYKVSAINAETGGEQYITTGNTYNGGNSSQIRTTDDASKASWIKIAATLNNNQFQLLNVSAGNAVIARNSDNPDNGMYTSGTANFTIAEAAQASVEITISADVKLATRIFPFAPELPEGVVAYSCEAKEEGDVLTLVEVDNPSANTPYILYAPKGYSGDALTGWGTAGAISKTDGWLTGVYAATAAPVGSYVLQKNNDVVAFYKVASEKQPNVGANRAYLTTPTTARALYFSFDDEATGVDTIKALTSGKTTIYNAAGAVVPSLQKGLNIIKMSDGSIRKVMVK